MSASVAPIDERLIPFVSYIAVVMSARQLVSSATWAARMAKPFSWSICAYHGTIRCHNLTSHSFISTLQEFAQELILLVDIMSQLHDAEQEARRYRGPWGWLRKTVNRAVRTVRTVFILRKGGSVRRPGSGSTSNPRPKQGVRKTLRRKFCESCRLDLKHF
jgi:hypothetical protein